MPSKAAGAWQQAVSGLWPLACIGVSAPPGAASRFPSLDGAMPKRNNAHVSIMSFVSRVLMLLESVD